MIACRNPYVGRSFNQRWNFTLPKEITSASHSVAITSEKCCVKRACRNLEVGRSLIQRRNVALPIIISSKSNSSTITSEEHCVFQTCRNLGVWHALMQRWNIALSVIILSASNSAAITPENYSILQRPVCSIGLHPKPQSCWFVANKNCKRIYRKFQVDSPVMADYPWLTPGILSKLIFNKSRKLE